MNWKNGFSLTAHEITLKFACDKKEEARKWFNKLKRLSQVVLMHFSRDFVVGKLLCTKNISKINIAIHSESGTQYAIKSISKRKLFEHIPVLVLYFISEHNRKTW